MTLRVYLQSIPSILPFLHRSIRPVLFAAALSWALTSTAQSKPAPNPAPDVLVLSNGDTLHGKFVNEVAGKVTFHSDPLGDVSLGWDKIKELHTDQKFAVIDKNVKLLGRKSAGQIPVGTFELENQAITLHPENAPVLAPIPVKDAQYILDMATLDKQVNHSPGFFTGWNGAATAGATIVTATVAWLNLRDRTSAGFTGSFGKITQPSYVAAGVLVPAEVTKSAIFHAGAERDEYFSPRFYALAQAAFDHNFGQDLNLQQIYGGGMGWTVVKTPRQEFDLRATIQYEKQQFISGTTSSGSSDTSQNLIGSTFAANYLLHMKRFTYTQGLAFIPAYNDARAYSTTEANTIAFPAYKNLSFSLGTMDSYLNDPPVSEPPTKRNSFQFTMGVTYAIKSKY
jgi:hypothetical protein